MRRTFIVVFFVALVVSIALASPVHAVVIKASNADNETSEASSVSVDKLAEITEKLVEVAESLASIAAKAAFPGLASIQVVAKLVAEPLGKFVVKLAAAVPVLGYYHEFPEVDWSQVNAWLAEHEYLWYDASKLNVGEVTLKGLIETARDLGLAVLMVAAGISLFYVLSGETKADYLFFLRRFLVALVTTYCAPLIYDLAALAIIALNAVLIPPSTARLLGAAYGGALEALGGAGLLLALIGVTEAVLLFLVITAVVFVVAAAVRVLLMLSLAIALPLLIPLSLLPLPLIRDYAERLGSMLFDLLFSTTIASVMLLVLAALASYVGTALGIANPLDVKEWSSAVQALLSGKLQLPSPGDLVLTLFMLAVGLLAPVIAYYMTGKRGLIGAAVFMFLGGGYYGIRGAVTHIAGKTVERLRSRVSSHRKEDRIVIRESAPITVGHGYRSD